MPEMDDITLLREYTETGSEAAFAALVERYINLVYSAALRSVGNAHAAEEITQAVFIILAKKARSLSNRAVLSGWLYQTTRLTAANFLRGEIRRQQREQEAYMQSLLNEPVPEVWPQIAPLLDAAMGRLGEQDRNAIVLRFFENKNSREVGLALGASEDAAKMRVNRALEKLRKFFTKRGVSSTTAILAGAISANSVQAVPVALAKSVTAVAVAKGATASTSTLTLIKGTLKLMAWAKAKTAIVIGTAAILATGTTAVVVKEIATPSGSDAARGPVEMKLKWQAGKKYVIHWEGTETTEMKQPGQPKPVKQVQKMTQDYNLSLVRELDNGGWQLQLEFEGLTMEVSAGGRKMFSADSSQNPAQDAKNPVGARMRKVVGARLQYFMNANGKVEKMEGYQELVKRVAGENPQEQAAFRDLFSENLLKNCGSFAEDTTPRRVVKLGDSWEMHLAETSNLGIINVDLKCTFKNWEQHGDRKCMRIKFTGNISPQTAPNTASLPVNIEKGRVSGEDWFDPELGMDVEITFDVDMNLKINQRGQILTTPAHETTRYALVEVEDLAK